MTRPRRGAEPAAPLIEVMVESPHWRRQRGAAGVVRRAVLAAAEAASTPRAELAILLTDDSAIRSLNRNWRGLDAPTNVLSFPAPPEPRRRPATEQPRLLGDIVIAYETTAREAESERRPFRHHLAHLAVHGFLHLVGYDHVTDRQARRMERLEIEILAGIGIPDPYAAHAGKV